MIKFFNKRPATHQEELDLYRAQSHQNFTTIQMRDVTVPIIQVDAERYEKMTSLYYDTANPDTGSTAKPGVIYSDLNILSDGLGHVFGQLVLTFSNGKTEQFLIDASRNLDFFEQMATSTMFAIAPIDAPTTRHDILAIQLPRRQSAEDALFKIQRGLAKK